MSSAVPTWRNHAKPVRTWRNRYQTRSRRWPKSKCPNGQRCPPVGAIVPKKRSGFVEIACETTKRRHQPVTGHLDIRRHSQRKRTWRVNCALQTRMQMVLWRAHKKRSLRLLGEIRYSLFHWEDSCREARERRTLESVQQLERVARKRANTLRWSSIITFETYYKRIHFQILR